MSTEYQGRVFDRAPRFDVRSRSFPISALVGAAPLRSYTWSIDVQLDQGAEGACVGFGWAHELAARPAVVPVTNDVARSIYREARQLDEWPGEDYDGSSVLGGAKAVARRGFMAEYRWAFSTEDVLRTLGHRGPVVCGTWWYRGMVEPNSAGRVEMTGEIVGGHCWLARGVNVKRGLVLCRNSWGAEWGHFGDFTLTFDQLDALLSDEGEACVPVGRDRVGDLT